jgi:hypothetical protein
MKRVKIMTGNNQSIEYDRLRILADKTGRTINDLRFILHFDNYDHIKTAKEAEQAHEDAVIGSEAQKAALRLWISLADDIATIRRVYDRVKKSKRATALVVPRWAALVKTSHEAKDLYKIVVKIDGMSSFKGYLLNLWNNLSIIELQNIKTVIQAMSAYNSAPTESGTEIQAANIWIGLISNVDEVNDFCLKVDNQKLRETAINKGLSFVHTPVEAKAAFEKAVNQDLKRAFINKWVELSVSAMQKAHTITKIKIVLSEAPNSLGAIFCPAEALRLEIMSRWNDLCIMKADTLSSVNSLYNVYKSAPNSSKAKDYIAIRLIPLIKTADKIRFIYENSVPFSDIYKLALDRWDKIIADELNKVKNIDQAKKVFDSCCRYGKSYALAIQKLYSFIK